MLEHLLNPRSIAVIGASHDERRPGGQPLHALTYYGYAGKVFAVNPRYADVNGVPCYPNIEAVLKRSISRSSHCRVRRCRVSSRNAAPRASAMRSS